MVGRGASTNPLSDMEKPDVMFCIGTNMTECHPVAATRLKRALQRGAKLIVADPRRIKLAELADLYLPLKVGTDIPLLLAMAHVIVRDGLTDGRFIQDRTTGYEEFVAHVAHFPPEWAEPITGVPAADIEKAARWYAQAERGAIYYTLGITEHQHGVDNVQSVCNLALLTGNLGKEGAGVNPMRGQNNVQGANDAGGQPNNFPGYQPSDDPAANAKFRAAYGREIDLDKGINKVQALERVIEGEMHAMLIAGENTLVSDADRHLSERALRKLDHLVVVDNWLTETAELAHVVLPATSWAETDGTVCNTERRVQRLRAAVPPQGEAKPDWWIVSEIAKRLGFAGFDYTGPGQIFDEMCALTPIYAGLSWDRISRESIQWPVPDPLHPGTPVLHVGSFVNGRGIFRVIQHARPQETLDADHPVMLTTGRRLWFYHTNTQTGHSAGLDYKVKEELLEVHPDTIAQYRLQDGGMARVVGRRGEFTVRVRATETIQPGTVFCSFSFPEVHVNDVTGSGFDPVTGTAAFKETPVRLEPVA